MGKRALVVASVIALAAITPGCITALAAVAGADGRVIQSTLEADAAILGAIGEVTGPLAFGDPEGDASATHVVDVAQWRCVLGSGDEQLVRAHSIEGARAACLMSNDVDLSGGGCVCAPLP